jgi:hypothetical protein
MDRTLISFNIANWITVLLMAAAGYAVLAVAKQMLPSQPTTLGS